MGGGWELGHEFRPDGAALGVQRIARIIARVRIILWIVVPQYRHLRSRGRRVSVFFPKVVNQMVLPFEGLAAAWVWTVEFTWKVNFFMPSQV